MKRIVLLLILTLIVPGCGSNWQSAYGEPQTFTHEYEQHGFALIANIAIGKHIAIDASLTNISGKTIIYNARCGIPFGIHIRMEEAHANLIPRDEKIVSCDDLFDPNDLREMKPNESFTKKIAFQRKVRLTDTRTVSALSGTYEVNFTFQAHGEERLQSSIPIELVHANEPEILTLNQARALAQENEEVMKWFQARENAEMPIEPVEAILSDGMWTVAFHAYHQDGADRIYINMDAKSGRIISVNDQVLSHEVLESMGD